MRSVQKVKDSILQDDLLNTVYETFKDKRLWLVGGFIRDLFLEKHSDDRDIVCIGPSKPVAMKLCEVLGGTFVPLDEQYEIYRVVLEDKLTYFDVSRALNDDIQDDAKRRDFTINSIFFDINKGDFFDPCGGINDIENKVIKTCNICNLKDDPLRMLRAFRFMSVCGFEIDNDIKNFVKNNFSLIKNCAAERINYEILKIFEGKNVYDSLVCADECALLGEIFPFVEEIKKIPPNTHHHLDLFHHCLETMRQIRIDKPLLKLAAFCHDLGKPSTHTIEPSGRHRFIGHDEAGAKLIKPILGALKFSKKQTDYVSLMIKYHIYPSALMYTSAAQDKAKIRFIRKLDPYVEDIIELARADRLSARGPLVSEQMVNENLDNLKSLLEYYYKVKPALEELPKLLDGKEIMQVLNLKPSPAVGKVADALKEAQMEGCVTTKEEALEFIKTYCKEV